MIDEYNIHSSILKIDCAGCDYALIEEDDDVFNNIDMIQTDYHYGNENLIRKLKNVVLT